MSIFKSSIVWGLFEYTEFFVLQSSGAQRLFDHPVINNVSEMGTLGQGKRKGAQQSGNLLISSEP
jgi:hypothetical protein